MGGVWILICRNNYVLHNHVHHPMFVKRSWNRVFNIIFGLSAGMPAGNWKIMHVHGHHVEHKKQALKGRPYIERFIIPIIRRTIYGLLLNTRYVTLFPK
ncbi:fatty acid desaturase [Litorimonas sp. WD9-15]|uniref:fatty acid desaturase n=1 Tax=Litorimonas sp. WD9-15 TaxID=3418716 RepID=UPI003CFDEB59